MDKLQFPFYSRCFATIDLQAVCDNFDGLKSLVSPGVKCCCVVKADAYGHGAVMVSKALEERADFFAVASLDEGEELRAAGIKKPVLILGYTHPDEFETAAELGIIPAIFHLEDALSLSRLGERLNKRLPCHIAVDTGMGRIGFPADEEGADAAAEIASMSGVDVQGVFSHYAKADYADKTSADSQTKLFSSFIDLLEKRGVSVPLKHICNTAGAMELPEHFDMVRFGIALYGLYPSDEVDRSRLALRPAMSVYSHVIHVKDVEAGTGIGYGHDYVAPERRRIATVSVGYADGFNRNLGGKASVLISGRRAPVCGRVCMDQIMVDVTDIDDVSVGDIAVILGSYGGERISAEELGALSSSFNYETVCTFMPRVKRFFCYGDQPLDFSGA